MRFPYESAHGPTQEIESRSSAPKINEWSLKDAWKNPEKTTYFCEQKNWTLQCQCPTEPTQWQEIKGTKFLTATRASNNAVSAILLSFQNLTTSILCSKMRLTGDQVGPIILLWVWVVTMLPPPSLEKFDAKHAKDSNATWNKNQVFDKLSSAIDLQSTFEHRKSCRQAGKDSSSTITLISSIE